MTDTKRRELIEELIREHTATHVVSQESARAVLIEEGIYSKKGELKPAFGGASKKDKAAA